MDTSLSILYKNTTAIALSIAKLKKDIEKTNSLLKEETTDLKNRNKITADNSKLYIEKLKASTKSQVQEINSRIDKLNEQLKKIDINKEITEKLKPYAKNEALEIQIKDLQKSINTISLTPGKQGEKGLQGLKGQDGKNGLNGRDGKDGKDGKDGQDGLTPIITDVETETISAGEYADVEIERNEENEYKMKFKIPRGPKGASGSSGTNGSGESLIEDVKVNGTSVITDKIAEITVPTNTSEINNDSGFITEEIDPIFSASPSAAITSEDINYWDNKSEFSGSYNDLTEKPVILEYTSGTGIYMQDSVINSCTDCGEELDINHIENITIPSGNWKQCHTYDGTLILFQVGSATIQISRNYIEYEDYTFAHTVKDISYALNNNVVLVLCDDGYIYYSFDNGITWVEIYVSALVASGAGYEKIYIDNSNYTTTVSSAFTLFKLYGESGTKRYMSASLGLSNGFWSITVSNVYTTDFAIRWVIKFGNEEMLITPTGVTYKTSGSNIVALNKDLPAGTINCVTTVNGVSLAGYGTTGKYAIYDSLGGTWGERMLPTPCSINAILYDSGLYYFLTDSANYYTTEVFSTYITVNETTDRFKDAIFTLMGLILVPNATGTKLTLVPQRTFIDDVLLKLLRGIDKSRWVSDGLAVVGEKVQVKNGGGMLVNSSGISVASGSITNLQLDTDTNLKLNLVTCWLGRVSLANFESFFYTYGTYDPGWVFKVSFVDGGTLLSPFDYVTEWTITAGDYGYFIVNSTGDMMDWVLLGNTNEWGI